MIYRNAARAFIAELAEIRSSGQAVTVRDLPTHERLARSLTFSQPRERFITIPGRRNDVFTTIAETMWVLAGRNDMDFLARYLDRALEFSDDQTTWRGGYGPRLRNWRGIDQVAEIRRLLNSNPESRRAVAVLFDPARDYVDTLDVPCNNWLHFLVRDGYLHLNVAVRSNDILWGFSGINTFEWSVLHEMMAFWLGTRTGHMSFFISSFHLYDERKEQADRTLAGFGGATGYEEGWVGAKFGTRWEDFDGVLKRWFDIEYRLASGDDCHQDIAGFPDPLLRQFLQAIAIKWAIEEGASEDKQRELVDELGHSDIAFALHEQLFRDSARLLTPPESAVDWIDLRKHVIHLHRLKDATYGNSWKKRGELISIAANLAQKIDRIEKVVDGAAVGSGALLDTAVDLLVYAVKYETFLADQSSDVAEQLFPNGGEKFSDDRNAFELLIQSREFVGKVGAVHMEAADASLAFDELDTFLQHYPCGEWMEKLALAQNLTATALRLVYAVALSDPDAVDTLRRNTRRS